MRKGIRFSIYTITASLLLACLIVTFSFAQQEQTSIATQNEIVASGDVDLAQPDKISLDLRGVEITELFKILSRKSDLNIIPSSQVQGRVNIFLNNISVEDAIELILVSQNLAVERKGNILYVMTAEEYQQTFGKKYYEKRKLKIFKLKAADPQAVFNVFSQIKSDVGKIIIDPPSATVIVIDIPEVISDMEAALVKLEQLQPQEIFELNYAKAEEIQGEVSKVLTTGTSALQVDKRTNKLVISDLPEKLKLIKDVITAFDEPTPQVFIEAEIIQVALSDKYQHGISWERVFNDPKWHGLKFSGKYYGAFPLESATTFDDTKQGYVSVGTLTDDGYHSIVQFLETIGKTNVLSRPRIAVLNNEEAKILIGTREAYTTGTLSQAEATTVTSETVEFIDVGVKLNVVPTITYDDYIIMKIKPEVSIVKEYLETSVLQSRIPIVETSEAETTIKVKNGSMIMIGGLIKKEKTHQSLGLPYLSKLPLIGPLFGSKLQEFKKTELIIFLRPNIITGDTRLAKEEEQEKAITLKHTPKGFQR
jgi:type II secretory pathway component GspD/PulD (secretin)